MRRTANGLDAFARLEHCGSAQAFDDFDHGFPIEHPGNVVGYGRSHFTSADRRQVAEERKRQLTSDRGKGVSVEEKERGLTMKPAQKIQHFLKSQDLLMHADSDGDEQAKAEVGAITDGDWAAYRFEEVDDESRAAVVATLAIAIATDGLELEGPEVSVSEFKWTIAFRDLPANFRTVPLGVQSDQAQQIVRCGTFLPAVVVDLWPAIAEGLGVAG